MHALPDRIFTSKDRIFSAAEEALSAQSDGVFQSTFNDG
jgi:hypothetical protein